MPGKTDGLRDPPVLTVQLHHLRQQPEIECAHAFRRTQHCVRPPEKPRVAPGDLQRRFDGQFGQRGVAENGRILETAQGGFRLIAGQHPSQDQAGQPLEASIALGPVDLELRLPPGDSLLRRQCVDGGPIPGQSFQVRLLRVRIRVGQPRTRRLQYSQSGGAACREEERGD
jgi:hypothetical protein